MHIKNTDFVKSQNFDFLHAQSKNLANQLSKISILKTTIYPQPYPTGLYNFQTVPAGANYTLQGKGQD